MVEGRMEKHPAAAGAINVVVSGMRPVDVPRGEEAEVVPLPAFANGGAPGNATPEEWELAMQARAAGAGGGGGGFHAVAPPVQSFASGRRR
jgi:hypothetical protein